MNFTLKRAQFLCTISLFLPFAAFAAHPMITEDTCTQGTGKFQLEANTEHVIRTATVARHIPSSRQAP